MRYFDFPELKRLVDFSDRASKLVEIPAASTLTRWLRSLQRTCDPSARDAYLSALGRSTEKRGPPFDSIIAAPGTPPPALALVLGQEARRTPTNSVPEQDVQIFLDALTEWNPNKLNQVVAGNEFDTTPLRQRWAPIDITGQSPKEKRKRVREWSQITGIVLHQTGVHGFGEGAWKKTTAHLGVHSDGRVFLIHPLESYLWSSDEFNRDTVAIEVAGNFVGDESKPDSHWKKGGGPSELTEEMVASLRRTIRWIIDEVGERGGKISYIYAHRQTSKKRPICPGPEIWKQGGVWAQIELGLSDGGPGYTRGDGRALPEHWDPRLGDDPDYVPEGTSPGWVRYIDEHFTVRNILLGGLVLTGTLLLFRKKDS